MFKLGMEKSCQQVRWQIARPDVYPRVLIYLAAEKSAPVRSLFPKDLGALIKLRIIDQQRAPFSAREILGLVETQGRKLAKGAKEAAAIFSIKTMRVIFDNSEAVAARERDQAAKLRRMGAFALSPDLPYGEMRSLSFESRQKLAAIRPSTLAQAARVPGVSPTDLQNLVLEIEKRNRRPHMAGSE